jgi:hypothetical protein
MRRMRPAKPAILVELFAPTFEATSRDLVDRRFEHFLSFKRYRSEATSASAAAINVAAAW